MIYLYIYIALFVGTLVYAVWDSHNKVKYIPFKEGYPTFLGIKTKETAWFLLFVSALVAPIMVPLLIAGGVYRLYRKIRNQKRPKPIPKNIRRFIKPDRVLDENNSAMSIDEYNQTHLSNFSLEQVYGKKYVDSIPQEEQTRKT